MPAAMSLVPSSTEPPPTESRKSTFSVLPRAMALRRVSILGLGSMPQNSTKSRPLSAATTWSYTPFFLTEPPPKVTMIFLSAGISFASLAMEPLPKINLTGFWKVKLFIRFSFILFVFPTNCRKVLFVGLKALFQASYFMPHFRATVCTRTLSAFAVRTCGRGIWQRPESPTTWPHAPSLPGPGRSVCRCSRSSRPT